MLLAAVRDTFFSLNTSFRNPRHIAAKGEGCCLSLPVDEWRAMHDDRTAKSSVYASVLHIKVMRGPGVEHQNGSNYLRAIAIATAYKKAHSCVAGRKALDLLCSARREIDVSVPCALSTQLDLNDKDPGARNTESSEKPKVEPREKPSEKPKVEPFEKPKVEMTTAADTAMQIDDTPAAAVGGEATSSVSKPIVQASPTTAREVEQQQQDQQAPQQQAPQQQDQQVPQQQDQQAPQQQDQQAPQQQDQQAPQQQDQQAPQQQDQQALQQQAPQQQDQQVPQQQDQQAPQQQDQQAPQQQDQQAPQQQDQQAPQQQQQQNQQEEHKPQQQQQQPSRSGVATDMVRTARFRKAVGNRKKTFTSFAVRWPPVIYSWH